MQILKIQKSQIFTHLTCLETVHPSSQNSFKHFHDIHENHFFAHLLFYLKSLSDDVHLLKRPRKSQKMDFEIRILKELVRVGYHFK